MLWHYAVGKPKGEVEPTVTDQQVVQLFDGVIDAVRGEVTYPVAQRRIDQAVLRMLRPIGPLPSATERPAAGGG